MSAPAPDALRVRFQSLIEEGLSGRAAALRLKLSPATGATPEARSLSGKPARYVRPVKAVPKGTGKLDLRLP